MAYGEGKAPLIVPKGEDGAGAATKTVKAGSNPPPPKTDGR